MATFSVTDRGTFKRCRRLWNYSSNARLNLTKMGGGAEPLELGGLIHRALAEWIVSKEENVRLTKLFLLETAKRIEEVKEAYLKQVGAPINDEELNTIYDVVNLGCAMMENYQEYHGSPIPDNMKFASAEQEVLVPVPGTEHQCQKCFGTGRLPTNPKSVDPLIPNILFTVTKCDDCVGTGTAYHYLSATFDGLLQDERDWLYVLEHKTYGQVPKKHDLFRTDQFTAYAWMLWKLDIGPVGGIAYDGMWKRNKIPRPVKGVQKTMDDMFTRLIIPKSIDELQAFEVNLTREILDMANDPAIYPNIPPLGCNGLSSCSFVDVCDMELRGEDSAKFIKANYTQRITVRGGGIRNEQV